MLSLGSGREDSRAREDSREDADVEPDGLAVLCGLLSP